MTRLSAVLATAAVALLSTPALAADFTGPRVGINAGYADSEGEGAFTYAANIGYDIALNEKVIAGVTLEVGDTDETDRDLAATVRLGAVASDKVLVYALGGYTNLRAFGINLDGFRAGAGVEFALTDKLYLNAEYRYSNYELGADANGGVVGIGFRF